MTCPMCTLTQVVTQLTEAPPPTAIVWQMANALAFQHGRALGQIEGLHGLPPRPIEGLELCKTCALALASVEATLATVTGRAVVALPMPLDAMQADRRRERT